MIPLYHNPTVSFNLLFCLTFFSGLVFITPHFHLWKQQLRFDSFTCENKVPHVFGRSNLLWIWYLIHKTLNVTKGYFRNLFVYLVSVTLWTLFTWLILMLINNIISYSLLSTITLVPFPNEIFHPAAEDVTQCFCSYTKSDCRSAQQNWLQKCF